MIKIVKTGFIWLALAGAGLAWGQDLQPRIIGGTDALPGESQFFAALMQKLPSASDPNESIWRVACGGSYIGDGLVMTAAHCLGAGQEYKILLGDPDGKLGYSSCGENGCTHPSNVFVGTGIKTVALLGDVSQLANIRSTNDSQDILIHKNYLEINGSSINDIALIRLQDPNPSGVTAVNLPNAPFSSFIGSDFTVVGLGDTNESNDVTEVTNRLQRVNVPAVSANDCARQYASYDDDIMICAGYDDGTYGTEGKDSCQGDSGGPLFSSGAGYTQYGIVSFGRSCAVTYGVYSDVYGLHYWIDNVRAYWLYSIDFDWEVDFGIAEGDMSRSITWEISNNSDTPIQISTLRYNNLPGGFSEQSRQCGSNLGSGDSCTITFAANFNSPGAYESDVAFDADGREYTLKFSALVVAQSENPTTPFSKGGGGGFSVLWGLFALPLVLFRRTRKGLVITVLVSMFGVSACSSNPLSSDPPEVVFNPVVSDEGIEFSVMSNGCTQENDLLLKVNGDEVEVTRVHPDMCRAAPQLKRFVMPLPEHENVWQLVNPARYSNRVSR